MAVIAEDVLFAHRPPLAGRDIGLELGDLLLQVVLHAQLAAEAGARSLVLTHLPPWNDPQVCLDQARSTWDGPLDVARPGATYDL